MDAKLPPLAFDKNENFKDSGKEKFETGNLGCTEKCSYVMQTLSVKFSMTFL